MQNTPIKSPTKVGLGVSESMIVDAVADVFMREIHSQPNPTNPLETSAEFRRVGEEVILEKIKGIFDEVAGEQEPPRPRQEY